MPETRIKQIAEFISKHAPVSPYPINLHWRGDPFFHPRISAIVRLLLEQTQRRVALITHGWDDAYSFANRSAEEVTALYGQYPKRILTQISVDPYGPLIPGLGLAETATIGYARSKRAFQQLQGTNPRIQIHYEPKIASRDEQLARAEENVTGKYDNVVCAPILSPTRADLDLTPPNFLGSFNEAGYIILIDGRILRKIAPAAGSWVDIGTLEDVKSDDIHYIWTASF